MGFLICRFKLELAEEVSRHATQAEADDALVDFHIEPDRNLRPSDGHVYLVIDDADVDAYKAKAAAA